MPKPRILGADGAGIRVDTGERVVLNPGLEHGSMITVIGEHTDGTHAELIAVPESNVFPLDDAIDFETAAAFPLVYETAYRMLVTKAQLQADEWVLIWGIGGGVATASFEIARALGAKTLVTSGSDEKLERAREWGADLAVNHATGDVAAAAKEIGGVDVVVETVGEATWKHSLAAVKAGGRVTVCGATSGPNPPAQLHRFWWKQLTVYGSTMGTREDFLGAYELVRSGRARVHVDSTFPLSETRAAHERLERGEQLGKISSRSRDGGAGSTVAPKLFAPLGPTYDRYARLLSLGQDPRWRRFLVSRLEVGPNARVLDVATGTGAVALELVRQHGCSVVGIDRSPEMLAVARERVAAHGLGARSSWTRDEPKRCRFPTRSFDALTVTYLLRYVDDPAATIPELARVVRPGGTMAMLDFGVPQARVARALWELYVRVVLRPQDACSLPAGTRWAASSARASAASRRACRSTASSSCGRKPDSRTFARGASASAAAWSCGGGADER